MHSTVTTLFNGLVSNTVNIDLNYVDIMLLIVSDIAQLDYLLFYK